MLSSIARKGIRKDKNTQLRCVRQEQAQISLVWGEKQIKAFAAEKLFLNSSADLGSVL